MLDKDICNSVKEYICSNAAKLNHKEKVAICQMLSEFKICIKEISTGCVVDLNKLNDTTVYNIYYYMKHRLEQ